MKEALDHIHMPKIPKISKPAFLKKKKEDSENPENPEATEGEDKENVDAEKTEGEEGTEAAEATEAEAGDKKPGFLDNLKSQAQSLLNKTKPKDKDVEEGEDKEESKELLEKKEVQVEGQETTEEASEPKPSLLQNLRNVASQVFKSKKSEAEAEKDVEAGEKDELLEGKEGLKEGKEGELEEVKVVEGEDKGEDGEDEKKDPEKPYSKYLNQACEARDICLQKYNGLERPKQLAVLGTAGSLLLLLFILIIVCIATPSQWTNYARISECGKYVTTHTNCGPIQGLVEGIDQFSFKRIPYAVPVQNTDRYNFFERSSKILILLQCF